MVGNVWEWTSGVYAQHSWKGYEMRVVRGASWDNAARAARLDARAGLSRRGRHNIYVGFRCVRN
jgi:formylglycine-generating enzyme required for sulfatase activity